MTLTEQTTSAELAREEAQPMREREERTTKAESDKTKEALPKQKKH